MMVIRSLSRLIHLLLLIVQLLILGNIDSYLVLSYPSKSRPKHYMIGYGQSLLSYSSLSSLCGPALTAVPMWCLIM